MTSLVRNSKKFQEEAWELELAWLDQAEGIDAKFAEKRRIDYKYRQWHEEHGEWTHRVYVKFSCISRNLFIALQRKATKLGVLGSERIPLSEINTLYNCEFDFCIISHKTIPTIINEMYDFFYPTTPYIKVTEMPKPVAVPVAVADVVVPVVAVADVELEPVAVVAVADAELEPDGL
jgi:hypothetical protein